VARWLRSLASLLTVVTIAGTPALLSACVALCMPDMAAHVAVDHTAGASMPAHHAAPPADAATTACAEHPAGATTALADALFSRAGGDCCADGLAAPAASVTAHRADTRVVDATVLTPRASWAPVPTSHPTTLRLRPAGIPPSPPRLLSVLRV
jgi:hypothetical protein